jgi:hydroxymethylbilane synthase
LSEVGGKALWTKELDVMLASGDTDFSVHSMKDGESERPAAFVLAAMLPRADVRDRLIGADSIATLPRGAVVGTSSPRRAAQLLHHRPDLTIVPIRGNVQTRLDKLARHEADATLLAAAGLERLGMSEGAAIPADVMLPAPGQAAIGIECRAADGRIRNLLAAIDHAATSRCVAAERAFSLRLGGTCHSPVAALAELDGGGLRFRAELLSADGRDRIVEDRPVDDEGAAAELAAEMLSQAPESIRSLFAGAC